jgi:predicted small lipoprotein YifL
VAEEAREEGRLIAICRRKIVCRKRFGIDPRSAKLPRILESAVPQSSRHLYRYFTLGVLVTAFLLSACGRKGPLDPPPGSSAQPPANVQSDMDDSSAQPGTKPNEFGQDGRPVAPRGVKRKLPGDALID